MSILVLAIDGPSPNVASGLPDTSGAAAQNTFMGTQNGTGPGLKLAGIAGATITSHEVEVIPGTIPVPQIDAGVAGVASGLSASPNPGKSATSITNVVPDQNG